MSDTVKTTPTGLQDMVAMALRHRQLFFIAFSGVVIAAMTAGLFMPKIYQATALLKIKEKKIIDPVVNGQAALSADMKDDVDTLAQQVTSWPKLERLVDQLQLAQDAATPLEREDFISGLKKRIAFKIKNRNIVEISFQDSSPVIAQYIANRITQDFIEENRRIQKEEARNAIEFLSEQLAIYRGKLDESQESHLISRIDADLQAAENRRILLKDRMRNLRRTIPSQAAAEKDPVVARLQEHLALLMSEMARLTIDAREGNPQVAKLEKEIASVRKKINAEKKHGAPGASAYNPLYLQSEQELKQVEMEIAGLMKHKSSIESENTNGRENVSDNELANYERTKKVDEDIYQTLLKQIETAYVSERLQHSDKGNHFIVVESARLPLLPVKSSMVKFATMGLMGGLFLGFGLVYMVETIINPFQTVEQAKEVLGLQCLGAVSRMQVGKGMLKAGAPIEKKGFLSQLQFVSPYIARPSKGDKVSPLVVTHHDPKSRIAEEFRVFRTHLAHRVGTRTSLKTLLVTSTLRGEGKSTASTNLAVALADSGKETLLIDGDLRRGSLHRLFSLPSSPGLSEVLAGREPLERAIIKSTAIARLHLLPCGARTERPAELLGSVNLPLAIDRLRGRYDMIIIDAQPVLNMSDACVLSRCADGVVMVVQVNRVKQKDVLSACATLKQVDAKIEGFVLTNIEYYLPRYMYDYYYEYT